MTDNGRFEDRVASRCELVVAPRRSLLRVRDCRLFPMCRHESFALQAAQDRIDGAAREPGRIENVEAVTNAIGERMEDERRGIRQIHAC